MLEQATARAPGYDSTAVRGLRTAAVVLLGIGLPVAMVAANKSAPAVLVLATLLALAAAWRGRRWADVVARHNASLRGPVAWAALTFAALAAFSLLWSIDRAWSVHALGQSFLMAYVGVWAAAAFPAVAGPGTGRMLVAGLAVAAVLALVDASLGMRIHGWLGERLATFDLKRSCIVLVLLVWPALAFLLRRALLAWAVAPVLPLAAVVKLVSAATAALGLSVGLAAWIGGRIAPRAAVVLAGLCTALLLALAPVAGGLASRFLPAGPVPLFSGSHAVERVAIWSAFETRFFDRPLFGYGFDTSARVADEAPPGSAGPDPAADATITKLHPHNCLLQIWVELGAAGAAAAAFVLGAIVWTLGRSPPDRLPERLALFASAVAMTLVGFGLWQAWWSASLAGAVTWFLVIDGAERRPEHG